MFTRPNWKVNFFFIVLLGVLLTDFSPVSTAQLIAQTGKNTTYWNWSPRGKHHDAIVQIESGGGFATGVIVHVDKEKPVGTGFEGWCLTAWHAVSDDNDQRGIKVVYPSGERAKNCKVISHDEQNDVALLWVWVPDSVEAVTTATDPVRLGDEIEFAGLGGNSDLKCCIRHFKVKASMSTNPEQLFADVPLLPGDSGGPVFNSKQELVGIISGGWFWLDAGVETNTGDSVRATWPARAGNLATIERLLNDDASFPNRLVAK